jgi:hypothetical protein
MCYICLMISDMASSSTNSSTNQTDKSNQSSESSDQSKEILSTTSKDVEQTINETKVTTTKRHRIGIYY